jgi:hypothetical protein
MRSVNNKENKFIYIYLNYRVEYFYIFVHKLIQIMQKIKMKQKAKVMKI